MAPPNQCNSGRTGLQRVNNNTSPIMDSAELIAGASTLVRLKKDRKAASLKYRKKKHLKNQISKNNGNTLFKIKKTKIWHGNTTSGRWIQVSQLCRPGELSRLGSPGMKGTLFHGIVVMMADGSYEAVEQSLIMRDTPVVARHGSHQTSKGTCAVQVTGECFEGQYIRVRWCDGKEQWLNAHQVEPILYRKRKSKPILDRFVAGGAANVSEMTNPPKTTVKMSVLNKRYLLAKNHMTQHIVCTIPQAMAIAFADSDGKMKRKKEDVIANVHGIAQSLVDLSLTYAVFRGEITGSISDSFDCAFGLDRNSNTNNHHNGIYLDTLRSITTIGKLSKRKQALSNRWQSRKKICVVAQCNNCARLELGDYCIKHNPKPPKMCNSCKLRRPKRKGGLCEPCFNKVYDYARSECIMCKARSARKHGGKCSDCLS